MKIGIFDSGIGGLSLLFELGRRLPEARFVYFADSENAPYGEKSADEILALTDRALSFFFKKEVSATVLACNTATAAAAKTLRAKYPDRKIFGMEPAVNEAAKKINTGKILATATPLTLGGEKYQALLGRTGAEERTVSLPLPRLVRIAERELFERASDDVSEAREYIEERLGDVGVSVDEISAIVLGCTHFTYFKEVFSELLPDRPIFNGVVGTASHVIKSVFSDGEDVDGKTDADGIIRRTEFYISGREADERALAGAKNCLSLLSKMTF